MTKAPTVGWVAQRMHDTRLTGAFDNSKAEDIHTMRASLRCFALLLGKTEKQAREWLVGHQATNKAGIWELKKAPT